MIRLALLLIAVTAFAQSPARRVLLLTHSAGFRHSSIETAIEAFREIANADGRFTVTATEDLNELLPERLAAYEAVFFFTSGELPISDRQRQALLDFVRSGKGFGGAHSATDTLYQWPEYGELIGGYFDGHPWTQVANVHVEDPQHPLVSHYGNSFRLLEEFYQFRAWDRSRTRVLLTLDASSVNTRAEGVNRADLDFALAWCHRYGAGRVFYTAFGHFEDTWRDAAFRRMLLESVLWLTGQTDVPAEPRRSQPQFPEPALSPGSLAELTGSGLTTGSRAAATAFPLPSRLAGTSVSIGGHAAPLVSVQPDRLVFQVPWEVAPGETEVRVATGNQQSVTAQTHAVAERRPRILATQGEFREGNTVVLYCAGLGSVSPVPPTGAPAPSDPLARTVVEPVVLVNDRRAAIQFSGLAPGLAGVYQVNIIVPAIDGPLLLTHIE